jgi:DNA-binding MarR family transcriptional regulator
MTSKVLRTLEKKRYIYRRNNEKDSRAKTVWLTTEWSKLINILIPIVAEKDKKFFEEIEKEKWLKGILHNFYIAKSA